MKTEICPLHWESNPKVGVFTLSYWKAELAQFAAPSLQFDRKGTDGNWSCLCRPEFRTGDFRKADTLTNCVTEMSGTVDVQLGHTWCWLASCQEGHVALILMQTVACRKAVRGHVALILMQWIPTVMQTVASRKAIS
jgi:hypothetical protein